MQVPVVKVSVSSLFLIESTKLDWEQAAHSSWGRDDEAVASEKGSWSCTGQVANTHLSSCAQ